MKTLNDCKKEVAKSLGMPWEKILLDRTLMDTVVEGVARRYAEHNATDFLKWLERTNTINNSGVPPHVLFKMYKNQNKEEQK